MFAARVLVFVLGAAVILNALSSAIRTFIVPRGLPSTLTRWVFIAMRVFILPFMSHRRPERQEVALAFMAPVGLLSLPIVWLASLLLGYTAIYWSLGASSWATAFSISRLSLLYLGSNVGSLPGLPVFAFSETVLSLLLAAILVSYLPTIYAAFSQREASVTGLETRAGSPPTPLTMLTRYYKINGMDRIGEMWSEWQGWFEVVEETHTALLPLLYYRSPQPDRSWVTAAGAVLDTASITASSLDRPRDPEAELCIRAGYLCLGRIAGAIGIPYNLDPSPTDPISVTQDEYDKVYEALKLIGVPMKPDRAQAWRDFAGWRVNYDVALVALAALTMAPPAPWSSDRVPQDKWKFLRSYRWSREVAIAVAQGRSLR
jgi:hypothetical protein